MLNKTLTDLKYTNFKRHYVFVAALVVCAGLLLLWSNFAKQNSVDVSPVVEEVLEVTGPTMVMSLPESLRIPKIEVDTTFEKGLGLTEEGEIEVPDSYEELGWYQYGPTPGQLGPSVVLGHVDSYEGPAVFFRLGELVEGDLIEIDREDGTTAVFAVEKLQRVSQNQFPTADVYGDIDHAGLRLVTCSGVYDRGQQRYSHNLIVYAKLIKAEQAKSTEL